MLSTLLQKLKDTVANPGFYRPLTAEEQAELFLELLKPKEEPKKSIIPPFIVGGGMSEKKVRQIVAEEVGEGVPGEGVTDHGALTGLADDDHTQYHTDARGDARYFTQSQVTTSLSGKADTIHTHTKSQITDFDEADYADAIHNHAISDTTGLQTALDGKAATTHSHSISDTTGLQTALDGKSGVSHTHIIAEVSGLQTALNGKADSLGADDNYVTDAEKTKLTNLSGTNSGDNAANSLYSGLAASKQDTLVSATNIKTINGSSVLGAGDLSVGAAPAGSDTQIQFNDGGAAGADADFTWNKTTNSLSLSGADTGVNLTAITSEPSTPSAGVLRLYSKSIAGRTVLKAKGPSGVDTPLQNAFWNNAVTMWNPTTATAGVWLGSAGAGAGTYSTALPTDTSLYTSMKRGRWANVITTANQVLGQRNTEARFFRGSAVSGAGGFFFYTRCGFDVWTNGGRFFAGMHSGTTVISANPSSLNNTVGFCVDSGDNGAISFLTRGTGATKDPTGYTITSGKGYDLYIFCAPGSSQYTWRIVDINAGTEASGTATLTLPTNTTKLTAGVLASNAAVTPATSIQLGVNRIYVETDY